MLNILNKILSNQMDADAVLAKLDEILKAVNPNLPVKTYFCNGMWKTVGPSANAVMAINMGGDDSVFKTMTDLNNSGHFQDLIKLCLEQIQSKPEWLTSRLFCAVGYLGIGEVEKAKAMLAEFDAKTGPAYDADGCKQASDFLHSKLH